MKFMKFRQNQELKLLIIEWLIILIVMAMAFIILFILFF